MPGMAISARAVMKVSGALGEDATYLQRRRVMIVYAKERK